MLRYGCSGSGAGRELFVLLPGITDIMQDYEAHGFVETAQESHPTIDLVLVDAHYGYYADCSILERLRQDIIAPARACGYEQIWIGGISMGGIGALLYAREFPADVSGVLALAPFLGEPKLVAEITAAGGLRSWRSDSGTSDYPRQLWQWLKLYERPTATLPALYLGYGDLDKFAPAHQLLAEILPTERVLVIEGRHDWKTWRKLWALFLARKTSSPGSLQTALASS
jgi:pimeloyl-ACP methyl ester carboxylesterase